MVMNIDQYCEVFMEEVPFHLNQSNNIILFLSYHLLQGIYCRRKLIAQLGGVKNLLSVVNMNDAEHKI